MAWISEQKNANILYPGCCCVVTIPRKVCQSTLEAKLISWPGHFSHSDTPQKFAHYRPLPATIKGQSRPIRGLTNQRPVSVIIRLALDRGKVTTADLTNTDPWVMSWPSKDNGGPWQYKILCHAIITCHVTQCYNVLHVTPVILRGLGANTWSAQNIELMTEQWHVAHVCPDTCHHTRATLRSDSEKSLILWVWRCVTMSHCHVTQA